MIVSTILLLFFSIAKDLRKYLCRILIMNLFSIFLLRRASYSDNAAAVYFVRLFDIFRLIPESLS